MLDIHGYYFHPTEIKVYYNIAKIILIGSICILDMHGDHANHHSC